MALYYLPLLIRSDRYFVARLEHSLRQAQGDNNQCEPDFNFVVYAEDRVLTPLLTIEDPGKDSIEPDGAIRQAGYSVAGMSYLFNKERQ